MVLGYPFAIWIPPGFVLQFLGVVLGLGIGLRNYVEILFAGARSTWFGYNPAFWHNPDGLLSKPPADFKYRDPHCILFAVFPGCILGWRNMINLFSLLPCFFWYGAFPSFFVLSDAPGELCECSFEWKSTWSRVLALIFGAVIGVRFLLSIVCLCLSSVWLGPYPVIFQLRELQHIIPPKKVTPWKSQFTTILGIVLGLGVGARVLVQMFLYIPVACWYGGIGELQGAYRVKFKAINVENAALYPKSQIGRAMGFLFGFVLGGRNYLIVILSTIYVIISSLRWIMVGFFAGSHPNVHCRDGILLPLDNEWYPLNHKESEKRLEMKIGFSLGALLSLGMGMYNWVNLLTVCIVASIYGPSTINFPPPCDKSDAPACEMTTIPGKILGVILGVGLGFNNWIKLFSVICFHLALAIWCTFKGGWFGFFPLVRARHGLLSPWTTPRFACLATIEENPKVESNRSKNVSDIYSGSFAMIFGRFGSILIGLVLGWRFFGDCFTSICRCAWYGGRSFALPLNKTILGKAPEWNDQDWVRWLLSMFGFFCGWRVIIDSFLFFVVWVHGGILRGVFAALRLFSRIFDNLKQMVTQIALGFWHGLVKFTLHKFIFAATYSLD
jgi:hypothetical protein